MLSKQFILLFLASIFLLGLIDAKKSASEDPAEDGDEETSGKKSKKGKKKAATIDTSELEGVWESTFYFNHTESRVVARTCQKEGGLTWTITGTTWTQSSSSDPLYNSNGRWTIKELIRDDSINFVKIELLKNSIDLIEPCIGYMRDGPKLFMMVNSTNPSTCPQKFQFFNDVCSNTVDYTVSECQSGKCTKNLNEVKEDPKNSASLPHLGFAILVSFAALFY
ncbi:hypothetical protein DSO57_1011996 [Entomophthora muscae]|uniref:Uncharacterized protein n=2 Tax=Entomophthora muscae TaxID=34485 RepID=A0ACC2TGS9_9FUNG|nr:hypothetical protein DSO57_1011996 [Entomophthora muscae]